MMQAVYSASTPMSPPRSPRASPVPPRRYKCPSPRPSPRSSPVSSPNKVIKGYSKPVMPGYMPTSSQPDRHDLSHLPQRCDDSTLKDSIPAMSKPWAITCMICNILSPGLGTFLSGLSVLCCSRVRPGGGDKMNVLWVNTWVAFLQFITAFLFLLGWIWSIMWGAAFLAISRDYYKLASKDSEAGLANADQNGGQTPSENSTHRNSHSGQNNRNAASNNRKSSNHSNAHTQPMIVLQEAPVITQQEATPPPEGMGGRPLNPRNPRHQRILRRQNEDMVLSPNTIESIVINNVPVPNDNNHNQSVLLNK